MSSNLDSVQTLIIDDSRQMRLLLREILRGLGLRRVEEAGDGAEALEVMRHAVYDLLLVDWCMQPLDGIEFTKLLRTSSDSPNPYCTIIMISGHSSRTRVRAARDAGVNSFLVKPVSARVLGDHVHAAFHDARPYVRAQYYTGPDRRRSGDPSYRGPFRRAGDAAAALQNNLNDQDWTEPSSSAAGKLIRGQS